MFESGIFGNIGTELTTVTTDPTDYITAGQLSTALSPYARVDSLATTETISQQALIGVAPVETNLTSLDNRLTSSLATK